MHYYDKCAIVRLMHKGFYASGFLYNPKTEQILLQQQGPTISMSSPWFLFETNYKEDEEPETLFKQIILKALDIQIKTVHPIYNYFNELLEKQHALVYGTVGKKQQFNAKDNCVFMWFSFKEIHKLNLSEQTKHDIVVGQRVIDAAGRKSRGEHTFQ